jgi:tetratricopeptide (TPR) repeat protein
MGVPWVADIFLSYARSDATAADRLARELGEAGWSIWYDRELPAHRAYADVIASELESAAAVLVLWSKASAESQWVRSEANRARELGKLVQSRVGEARLPMPFDQIQCADLTKWRGGNANAGWSQVRSSISALVGGDPSPGPARAPAKHSLATRRGVLAGMGAAVIGGGAGTVFWLSGRNTDHPSPEAALLLQKGIDTLQSGDVFAPESPGALRDAIALLTEATKADPRSRDAWAYLALGYAALKRVSAPAERLALDERSRSAAAKAFGLSSDVPVATGALLLLNPLYGHWREAERADRNALSATSRRLPLLLFIMSDMLRSVGRCKEAAAVSIQFDRRAFIIPGADEQVLLDLWSAGDLQGADEALRLAIQHWPQHPQLWRTRLAYLMYSGRPVEALELVNNEGERPPGTPTDLVQAVEATAKALSSQGSASDAVARGLTYLKARPAAVFGVVHACAALKQLDTTFALLEGYYFRRGAWGKLAPMAGSGDCTTDALFQPPMKPAWNDARFALLIERIGLAHYWRESGTVPDFRHQ